MTLAVPGWERFDWLRAGFSVRQGGLTQVYGAPGECNLGWTKEDPAEVVAANRQNLVERVGGSGWDLVTMRQVHETLVRPVVRDGVPLATPEGKATRESDGLATSEPGLMLGVQTADCVPVLLADTRLRAVAAIHAGWRGTVSRIAEEGVAAMEREFGSRPEDLVAAIGPAIRLCCFAVGEEVRQKFQSEFVYADDLFTVRDGQIYGDLHTANRRQLIGSGLPEDAVTVIAQCSACSRTPEGRRRFFSHRAEHGVTGRMMGLIGVAREGESKSLTQSYAK
jgi:YfiH family protein